MEVRYAHPDVEKFVLRLDVQAQAKTDRLVAFLAREGPILGMPFTKKIGPNLFELRILGTSNIRLLYTYKDTILWVVHAISKKRDAIPARDIALAKARLRALLHI